VFHEPGLVEQFKNALAIWDVPAGDVVLEVTEFGDGRSSQVHRARPIA
jgi:hypothetical protein